MGEEPNHTTERKPDPTKYVYIKCTTVYVPSPELGLSHPLACGLGGGGGPIQFRRLEKKLSTLPTLCLSKSINILLMEIYAVDIHQTSGIKIMFVFG